MVVQNVWGKQELSMRSIRRWKSAVISVRYHRSSETGYAGTRVRSTCQRQQTSGLTLDSPIKFKVDQRRSKLTGRRRDIPQQLIFGDG